MSNPPATPHPTPPARPLPALGLPRAPRRLGPGVIVALIAHVLVIGAVIWERTTYLEGAMGDDGPRGGGSGGGGEELRYVALPRAATPQPETPPTPVPEVPLPVPQPLKLPETRIEIAPMTITPPTVTVVGSGPGGGVGPGGGGTGNTAGAGTGTDEGPGSGGGDGGAIIAAKLIAANFPMCERGRRDVRLWVGADGRVNRVEIDPPPKDADCRREFSRRMQQYRFEPAMTRDGRKVASVFTVTVER